MKRILGVILMLCLAAACLPAAADATGKAYVAIPEGELDLTKGPATFVMTMPEDASSYEAALTQAYANMGSRVYITLNFAYQDELIDSWSDGGSEGQERASMDLDLNGSADLILTYIEGEDSITFIYEEAPTNSCGKEFTLNVAERENLGSQPPYDIGYFLKLTFRFAGLGKSTYSDSTGSYEIAGGEAEYQKPAKDAASAKIPATVNVNGRTVPVTKIADNAFKGNKKLTKVTIGTNVREIGRNAFANCAKLKTVKGGANLEVIGDSAFAGCKALKAFTIGAKVTKIGKKAFNKCAALKKVTIKSTLLTAKTVGSAAFKGINAKATIKVPKAVKKDYSKWLLKKGVKKTMKIK